MPSEDFKAYQIAHFLKKALIQQEIISFEIALLHAQHTHKHGRPLNVHIEWLQTEIKKWKDLLG